jgi:hypothetical protein
MRQKAEQLLDTVILSNDGVEEESVVMTRWFSFRFTPFSEILSFLSIKMSRIRGW